MLRLLKIKVFLVVLLVCFVVVKCRNNEYLNPDWVDPHDWSTDKDSLRQLCSEAQYCKPCEKTAKNEYSRLVQSIFNPQQFRFDDSTNYFYRTIHIHVTQKQLDQLKASNDPIFIDGLISEILSQTEFGTVQLVKEYTVDVVSTMWDHLPSLPSIPDALPRSRPILINFAIMILTYFLCRRYRINYLIVVFFAIVYFLYEYLDNECHRRIELNEEVEFLYGKEKNPCLSPAKMKWYDYLMGRDSRSACRDFLARQSAHKNECGFIDLFHEFYSNVLLKQLKLFFITITDIIQSISTTYGILITAVALYFMKDLLVTIIQSVFKYILNPTIWSRVASDLNSGRSDEDSVPLQRAQFTQSIPGSDIRDINISKALDLANKQMEYLANKQILEQKRVDAAQMSSSGVQVLAVEDAKEETIGFSPSTTATTMSNEESFESFEVLGENEMISLQDIDVMSIDDNQPSTMSTTSYQLREPSPENITITSTDSHSTSSCNPNSNNRSEISTSDSMQLHSDSNEVLSISSDTASSF